ncbi:uncharacterized protein LOC110272138 [Arachis ipaensis]|uniref:uncharacterized protein LOC110272138 n=1 Tax=Arachis ipaensis TaxID=130454 RepID=UPI000A2B3A28|nr:uncharacterized protein LOC110272138 [Arachis ipaensis]
MWTLASHELPPSPSSRLLPSLPSSYEFSPLCSCLTSSFCVALVAASSLLAGSLSSSLLVAVSSGEGYELVQIQRKKRILKQRLKVPPALNQFTKTLDKNLGRRSCF